MDPTRATLDQARAPMFGRDETLRTLGALVEDTVGPVTLVGPGGVGKTTLARRALQGSALPLRATFCDVSRCHDRAELLVAVATALSVPLAGDDGWGLVDALTASPDSVLVLDNAEQVVAPVAELVGRCGTAARIVVTSRERLRVPGEQVLFVEPLDDASAVSLFRERLRETGPPGEDPDDHAVHEVVTRLDRLPLAVEIAAAHAGVAGMGNLMDGLDDQLRTLSLPMRGVPLRHATLHAAVDASWQLLDEADREALRCLSLFAGPFTIHGVQAVVADPGRSPLGVVTALLERSLVKRDGASFTLYTMVRAFAAQHRKTDHPAVLRHAHHVAALGETWAHRLGGTGAMAAAAALRGLRGDLLAARDRLGLGAGDLTGRITWVLDRLHAAEHVAPGERREPLAAALAHARDPAVRVRLALARAPLVDHPLALLEAACDDAEASADDALRARARIALGEARALRRDLTGGIAQLDHALAVAVGDDLRADALAARGRVWHAYGRVEPALADLSGARDLLDGLDAPAARASVLTHLAAVHDEVDLEAADALRAELADHRIPWTSTRDQAVGLVRLGVAQLAGGRALQAGGTLRRALSRLEGRDDVLMPTVLDVLARASFVRGRLAEMGQLVDRGLALARATAALRAEARLLGARALAELALGRPGSAHEALCAAIAIDEERGAWIPAGLACADRSVVLRAVGRDTEAAADLARARDRLGRPRPHHPLGLALALVQLHGEVRARHRAGDDPIETEREAAAQLTRLEAPGVPHTVDTRVRLAAARLAAAPSA